MPLTNHGDGLAPPRRHSAAKATAGGLVLAAALCLLPGACTGYSVGAVFSAYLGGHRSRLVGSFSSYSGGDRSPSGERIVPMPPHPIPGLLYHGGHADTEWAGKAATPARMAGNGQFTVVCDHGRGHVVGSSPQEMWGFLLAHPFSPGNTAAWATTGLEGKLPAYCQVR